MLLPEPSAAPLSSAPPAASRPRVFHLSGHVAQSNCWGLCGSSGRDGAFEWRLRRAGAGGEGTVATDDSTDPKAQLTCRMPEVYAAEMLFLHQVQGAGTLPSGTRAIFLVIVHKSP